MYIQTSSLRTIDLIEPEYSGIPLEEFARALSHINRFTGHAGAYSVAQHSVHVASLLPPSLKAHGLLHDTHEAVIGDITTPMKQVLGSRIRGLEALHERAAWARFGGDHARGIVAVKIADGRMCNAEADQLLGGRMGEGWPDVEPAPIDVSPWTQGVAFSVFMRTAQELGIAQ